MDEIFAHRPTYAEINLENLVFNLRSIRKFIGSEIAFMAVIKADAYGHGAVNCAKKLEKEKIEWLGVALPEEGLELRENNIQTPILCLGSFWAGQENLLLKYDITPVIYQLEIAEKFNRAAKERNTTANVHVKIDTGMGRIGVRFDECKSFAAAFRKFTNLDIEGIMTHFAAADDPKENQFTNTQIERFNECLKIFEENGFRPKYKDLANSPGAIGHKKSRENLVRIGGILYGLGDDVLAKGIAKPDLKPVLSLQTKIAHLKRVPKGETLGYGRTFTTEKDSIIATVPIGYEDGYCRSLSNKGRVIVHNQYAQVIGRISMDWTILDVSNITDVKVNDKVILIGESENLKVSTEEIAKLTDTISYEITCGINRRVIRNYVEGE